MFELFIALFGGIYLLGKYSHEKISNKKWDTARDIARCTKETMVNKKFEEELGKKIANPQHRTEIENLIKKDLQYVYGDKWRELFAGTWRQPNLYTLPLSKPENIVLMLMLSKSGLVPCYYRFDGIKISNFCSANAYECLKILHCVEENIKRKRALPNARLVFLPEVTYKVPRKKGDLGTPDYTHPCSGKFCWNFESDFVNPRYSADIRSEMLINSCKEASTGERSLASNPYKDTLIL